MTDEEIMQKIEDMRKNYAFTTYYDPLELLMVVEYLCSKVLIVEKKLDEGL